MITISINDQFYTEKSKILQALYQVIDPELFINIVDLGLIYDIAFSENNITIEMTLSTPHCPLGAAITSIIQVPHLPIPLHSPKSSTLN